MRILIELNHPAHIHLFRNAALALHEKGHSILLVTKHKDVLQHLANAYADRFTIVSRNERERKNTLLHHLQWIFESDMKILHIARDFKPDLLLTSGFSATHVGRLINKPCIVWSEEDSPRHRKMHWMADPFASCVLMPDFCLHYRWEYKTFHYPSMHELAYVSPATFYPDKRRIEDLIDLSRPYAILRLSSWGGYHDMGLMGLSTEIIARLIDLMRKSGNVYITSERQLEPAFEPYRIAVPPEDIHHALYYANMLVGDSLTMLAEAACMGTPTVLYSYFTGIQGYINDLEKHGLLRGVKPPNAELLLKTIGELLQQPNLKQVYRERRTKLLQEKIDLNAFMIWFVENYPNSRRELQRSRDVMKRFAFPTTEYTEL